MHNNINRGNFCGNLIGNHMFFQYARYLRIIEQQMYFYTNKTECGNHTELNKLLLK